MTTAWGLRSLAIASVVVFSTAGHVGAQQKLSTTAANIQTGNPMPTLHIGAMLGNTTHLVVRRSYRRVYVYRGGILQASYPIAVGKPGWETPIGTYRVFSKEVNPVFKSFRSGQIIPPGPDNPLGARWIGIWTDGRTQLGFHGTNEENLIGQAVSHGCIRMLNQDVVELYDQVEVGTIVTVLP
ncbi:MAG: L,D-transpeptidase [Cyanobacteria bacterium]|nr:L,D-transpeptidase [Cyanobacteriota bacterium]MDW8200600.1 L,D-transpeptidase [Cyanobacteriota bacterium SKYGB_h_bin112]